VPTVIAFTFPGGGDVATVTDWLSRRQRARTPQRGAVASLLYGVVAVLDLAGYFSLNEGTWMLVSGLCFVALCVTTLASAMSLHRRNKTQGGQGQMLTGRAGRRPVTGADAGRQPSASGPAVSVPGSSAGDKSGGPPPRRCPGWPFAAPWSTVVQSQSQLNRCSITADEQGVLFPIQAPPLWSQGWWQDG
jgi:hypothetical protein